MLLYFPLSWQRQSIQISLSIEVCPWYHPRSHDGLHRPQQPIRICYCLSQAIHSLQTHSGHCLVLRTSLYYCRLSFSKHGSPKSLFQLIQSSMKSLSTHPAFHSCMAQRTHSDVRFGCFQVYVRRFDYGFGSISTFNFNCHNINLYQIYCSRPSMNLSKLVLRFPLLSKYLACLIGRHRLSVCCAAFELAVSRLEYWQTQLFPDMPF